MPLLKKITLWLSGSFACRVCGKTYSTMSFGFGECICPDCYKGEERFLFFDNSYWLNRLVASRTYSKINEAKPTPLDPELMEYDMEPEIHTL